MVVQEREVSAQYTRAERKESLTSHSSEGQKLLGEPMHCFHLIRKEIRITCSIKQDQIWRSKNFMSSPSISASVKYNNKRRSIDWRCRTHNADFVESRREPVRLQEELSMKEKGSPRYSNTRNIHEMGEMNRAVEFRDSLYKN